MIKVRLCNKESLLSLDCDSIQSKVQRQASSDQTIYVEPFSDFKSMK